MNRGKLHETSSDDDRKFAADCLTLSSFVMSCVGFSADLAKLGMRLNPAGPCFMVFDTYLYTHDKEGWASGASSHGERLSD